MFAAVTSQIPDILHSNDNLYHKLNKLNKLTELSKRDNAEAVVPCCSLEKLF